MHLIYKPVNFSNLEMVDMIYTLGDIIGQSLNPLILDENSCFSSNPFMIDNQ